MYAWVFLSSVGAGTHGRNAQFEDLDGGFGNDGKQAKKLFGDRGPTKETIGDAKALLEKLHKVDGPLPDLDEVATDEANFEKAEQELWGWYLEWSAIARKAVKQRSLLLKLGFLRSSGNGKDEEVPDDAVAEKPENEGKP